MELVVLALMAQAEAGPCGEAIAEFAAYETLLRADPYFPLNNDVAPTIPMVFAAAGGARLHKRSLAHRQPCQPDGVAPRVRD